MSTVVGQASAAATSVAIPAHAVGDLIIVSARGTAAAPSVPAAGGTVPAWATIQSGLANSIGLTVVSFVATATTTTTGVFTNATHICVLVLRAGGGNRLQTSAARSSVGNGNNTQTIIYPALSLNNGGGASTSIGVRIGTRITAITAVGTPPSGWTNQSIQPAGASALMSVHTLNPLASNPTADTVTVTSSNAAYRAVTVEVEEVPLIVSFAATVARAAAVAVDIVTSRPPTLFAVDITANVPYIGEHVIGEFIVGDEDILAVDLQTIRMDFLTGGIAGQATVGASLAITKGFDAQIARAAAVAADLGLGRPLAVNLIGAGALAANLGVTKPLAAAISGQAQVSADLVRVPVSVTFGCVLSGAAVVAPSLTVTNASFVGFDTFVVGAAAVSAQAVAQRSLAAPLAGQGAVSPSLSVSSASFVSFSASVAGQSALSVDLGRTVSLSLPLVRAATVIGADTTVIRLIQFQCRIENIFPLCGEHLVGTFIVGGGDGPHATITVGVAQTLSWAVPIQGQAQISASQLGVFKGLQALIEGQSSVVAQTVLKLVLAAVIQGQASLAAKLTYDWLGPTSPADILLPPTTEKDLILLPTTPSVATLVATTEQDVALAPTEEEDWILVPTTERSM